VNDKDFVMIAAPRKEMPFSESLSLTFVVSFFLGIIFEQFRSTIMGGS
jgi:hypothetical protein